MDTEEAFRDMFETTAEAAERLGISPTVLRAGALAYTGFPLNRDDYGAARPDTRSGGASGTT